MVVLLEEIGRWRFFYRRAWSTFRSSYSRCIARCSAPRAQAHGKSFQSLSPLHQPNIVSEEKPVAASMRLTQPLMVAHLLRSGVADGLRGECFKRGAPADCNVRRPYIALGKYLAERIHFCRPAKGEGPDGVNHLQN
jgi:hypothetical protein